LGRKYSWYFVIIIILLIIIAVVNILPYFYIYPSSIDIPSDFLETHQGFISLFGIIITVVIFGLTLRKPEKDKKRDENKRISSSCNALLEELKAHRDGFNYIEQYVSWPEQNIHYCTRILNTDAYDGIVHSGLFTYFTRDTQNILSNLYIRIKARNECIKYTIRPEETFYVQYDSKNVKITKDVNILNYQRTITLLEKEAKALMNAAETLIHKELSLLTLI
jgi:hypothetical protein